MSYVHSRRAKYLASVALLAVIPMVALAQEDAKKDEVYTLKTNVAIPGGLTSFDISWVDPSLGKYFLADRTNKSVDVLNTGSSPSVSTQIIPPSPHAFAGLGPGCAVANACGGPNGLLTLKNTGGTEIWAGDGPTTDPVCPAATPKCSTVKVFSASATGGAAPTHVISTGGVFRADELCFDPKNNVVLIANDADSPPYVSFIPTQGPNAYTVVKQIKVPEATDGIEQCQWNPRTGMFYLNIPEVNGPGDNTKDGAVYVIDPKAMAVVNKFDIPVADCSGPQGMAIGPSSQILLGCNTPSVPSGVRNSVIINENSGVVIATLNNLGGADEVWFNEGDGHYFLALGSATAGHELGVVDANGHRPDATLSVTSVANPHSVAADPTTNFAYLPVTGGINIYAPSGRDDHPAFVRRNGGDD